MNDFLRLTRDVFDPEFTLGQLQANGHLDGYTRLGYICEDADRRLEDGGEKIYGKTAIPRGRYKVVLSFSRRFKRIMPELLNVPGFSGVRIHGGNTHHNTDGCPLLGAQRTANGVRDCSDVNGRLVDMLRHREAVGVESWITVE